VPKPFREVVAALRSSKKELRGSVKLRAALDAFGITVDRAICLDVGASTGGFTRVLLERGAARVYAVDAGHGQLLGSLRQDERVTNLEATNVGDLTVELVPDDIDVVTVDVSYLSLASAVAQLEPLRFAKDATLIGLVKPMFELRLDVAPTDDASLDRAVAEAVSTIENGGWTVISTIRSPVTGAKGAVEGFVSAQRT
jgi:23S rRNA (cytidine1920-2'-O)/16S rRNA (cytidine1409-2'-O)-methyltransferase